MRKRFVVSDGDGACDDLVMKSEYVVVDAYRVQRQKLLHRLEHVKHDGSEMMQYADKEDIGSEDDCVNEDYDNNDDINIF